MQETIEDQRDPVRDTSDAYASLNEQQRKALDVLHPILGLLHRENGTQNNTNGSKSAEPTEGQSAAGPSNAGSTGGKSGGQARKKRLSHTQLEEEKANLSREDHNSFFV